MMLGVDKIGKATYGVVDNGMFGNRIVSGIITGIRFTEDKPFYEISFGKNSWWTKDIADNTNDLFELLNLTTLARVRETHGLSIKYN